MTSRDTLMVDLGIAYACCYFFKGVRTAKVYEKLVRAYAKENPVRQVQKERKYPWHKVKPLAVKNRGN